MYTNCGGRRDGISLRCKEHKRSLCKGRAKLVGEKVVTITPHTCEEDALALPVLKLKNKLKNAVERRSDKPREVYDRVTRDELPEVVALVPFDKIQSTLRKLAKTYPENPEPQSKTCAVCLDDYKDPSTLTPCGHIFCFDCATALSNFKVKECPKCRMNIKTITKIFF